MYNLTKRTLDFISAFGLMIMLLPVIIVCFFLLSWSLKGNPLFFQLRPGMNSRVFRLVKFRTMSNQVDLYGNLLPDAERLTAIGKAFRKLSLDEIPQLYNVLKGDMSLVGPRPLLVKYLDRYNQFQMRRHEVKPGITGWAQVNGRNSIDWESKFKLDVWYVDNASLKLDMRILCLTVLKVIKREGISSNSFATMEEFNPS